MKFMLFIHSKSILNDQKSCKNEISPDIPSNLVTSTVL